jgi:hypothetical protein
MKKFILLIITSLFIVACAPRYNQQQYSPAQSARDRSISEVNGAFSGYRSCIDRQREPSKDSKGNIVNQSLLDSFQLVDSQIIVRKEDSVNKMELLSSTSKVNEKQKKAILSVYKVVQECRKNLKDGLRGYPTLLSAVNTRFGGTDITTANLVSKKITIGEANQELAKIFSVYISEYNSFAANIDTQYNNQRNQEVQSAKAEEMQRRAIASQYLMNQQAINAQQNIANQQRLQNQLNNNRIINTNCNRMGNSVNCTSY